MHLVNQNLVLKKNGEKPDLMDLSSIIYLFALSLGAELERSFISEQTKAGLQNALKNGKILGRPRGVTKLDKFLDQIIDYKARGFNSVIISSELFREYNIRVSTHSIQRFIKRYNIAPQVLNKGRVG